LLWQQTTYLGFEQFATAAGIYAATNPLWPWITFQ